LQVATRLGSLAGVERFALKTKSATRLPFGSVEVEPAPARWRQPCANTECSLHQLSPYIGKIKSSIAGDLVDQFSKPGDLVVDPFAGAGTIPLEAGIRRRRAFGADISPYAGILSKAKLSPPSSLEAALAVAGQALEEAAQLPRPDLRAVPLWVRHFYHPDTLREALNFASICRRPGNEFLMACLLGILHHQRPGFLSYPSSHLVPYLRDKKFPRRKFPEMYAYRELKPRLLAKVKRSFKRFVDLPKTITASFEQTAIQNLTLPVRFGALITSPPYMNALDYGRDNRLRLWFIDPGLVDTVDNDVTQRRQAFMDAIMCLASKVERGLKPKGYCVFVVGEEFKRSFAAHPSEAVMQIMGEQAPSLRLRTVMADRIPDVRRTRRECSGVKTEHFLVFQRN
jgi:SAM-dependent methyltransferase